MHKFELGQIVAATALCNCSFHIRKRRGKNKSPLQIKSDSFGCLPRKERPSDNMMIFTFRLYDKAGKKRERYPFVSIMLPMSEYSMTEAR